jgi:hypothetical protein
MDDKIETIRRKSDGKLYRVTAWKPDGTPLKVAGEPIAEGDTPESVTTEREAVGKAKGKYSGFETIMDIFTGAGRELAGTGLNVMDMVMPTGPGMTRGPIYDAARKWADTVPEDPDAKSAENIGKTGATIAEYLAPAGAENKLAQGFKGLLGKTGLRSLGQRPGAAGLMGRSAERGIGAVGTGAISGTSAAGIAKLSGDDPFSAGNPAFTTAGALDFILPRQGGAIRNALKNSSRESYSRAIGGPPPGTSTEWFMENIVDPSIVNRERVSSLPKLRDRMKQQASEAMDQRKAIREGNTDPRYFPDVKMNQVEELFERAREKNRSLPMAGGNEEYFASSTDKPVLDSIDKWKDDLYKMLMKKKGYEKEYWDMPLKDVEKAGREMTLNLNDTLSFDDANAFKRMLQNFAAEHGSYAGKRSYFGQDPIQGANVQAADALGGEFRQWLEAHAPVEWAKANESFHTKALVGNAAESAYRGQISRPVPLAEQGMFGMGTGRGGLIDQAVGMAPVRYARRWMHSPMFQSESAIVKDWLSKGAPVLPKGMQSGVMAPAAAVGGISADQVLQPGVTVRIPTTPEEREEAIKVWGR